MLLTCDEGLIFFWWGGDLFFGNLEHNWLRSNRRGKCSEMGLRGELFCVLWVVLGGGGARLPDGRSRFPQAKAHCRGVGGSGGCWSELSPYVHRHPGDQCNMERFSI